MSLRKRPYLFLTVMTLVSAALAGCAGSSEDASGAGSDAGGNGGDPADGNQTMDDGDAGNGTADSDEPGPPVIAFDVRGQDVTQNGSQWETKILVEVTFDGSNSTDPAGGDLNITWDFGDGMPLSGLLVNYTFDSAGNYTIHLNAASSASGLNSSASISIAVAGLDTSGPGTEVYERTVTAPCTQCYAGGSAEGSSSHYSGQDCFDACAVEFPGDRGGWTFEMTSTGGDPDLSFWDSCDGNEGDFHSSTGSESGTVMAGATCAWIWEFADGPSDITLTLVPP